MDHNKIIGSNVRFERQKRNLTIDELSEILNIAPGFLGLIERGQRGTSIKNLCRIANFFSITLDQLITCPSDERMVIKEEPNIEKKRTTIATYISSMDEQELDFVIGTMKNFKKYVSNKNGEKEDI
ncbi:helix-turn-helix transcriptional regulator [uncultured Tyzzerella sp.]|uniref:helix-turn-helix domain-containing protein n=1 Tax=uncultured Tyzzerella sp. TaxID=2321398 RepID=UPI002942C337|nr:helix-turn-helix transcriptional regulator [uncultured Tyzzerella sp.]